MIEEFADGAALAAAATGAVVSALETGLRSRGSAALAATGGRSPGAVYDTLSVTPLDWRRVRVTLTDERWVEPSSPDSNEGLVRRRLLQGRAAEADFLSLHGPEFRGHDRSPDNAAEHASAVLAGWPPFDAVLLGMGDDGHIASLFPGNPALALGLDPAAPACIAVPQGQGTAPPQPRLSLTIRPLTTSAQVVILVSGAAKRAVLEQALGGEASSRFPVAAILQSAKSVRILWTAHEARA